MRVMHVLSQLSYASTAYITTFFQKFNTVFRFFMAVFLWPHDTELLLFWSHDPQLIVIASTARFSHDLRTIPGLAAFIWVILQGLRVQGSAFRGAWQKTQSFHGFYGNIYHI